MHPIEQLIILFVRYIKFSVHILYVNHNHRKHSPHEQADNDIGNVPQYNSQAYRLQIDDYYADKDIYAIGESQDDYLWRLITIV